MGLPRPRLATTTEVWDLKSLVESALRRALTSASDINDAGQLAAVGVVHGERHAYRLSPVNPIPELGNLIFLLGGAVRVLTRRRRARLS